MDLNNITVDSLKEKFAAFDRKTLIKFGIGIGAIILFLTKAVTNLSAVFSNKVFFIIECLI